MGYLNNIRLLWADASGLDIFLLRWNFLCNGVGYNRIWSPSISLTHSPSGGCDNLAAFAAASPAGSKEPNVPLICGQKLSSGALFPSPRSLWFSKCSSIMGSFTQSAFPRCLWSYLAHLPLNAPSLFSHNLSPSHITAGAQCCPGGFWVFASGWGGCPIFLGGVVVSSRMMLTRPVSQVLKRGAPAAYLATVFGV